MTLAQGAFLCLVFVFPILGAVVEWRSIDRVIAHLGDLPDDKYMNLQESGGVEKEMRPENIAPVGAVNLLSAPRSRSARQLPRGWWVLRTTALVGGRNLLTARLRCANQNCSKREEVSRS